MPTCITFHKKMSKWPLLGFEYGWHGRQLENLCWKNSGFQSLECAKCQLHQLYIGPGVCKEWMFTNDNDDVEVGQADQATWLSVRWGNTDTNTLQKNLTETWSLTSYDLSWFVTSPPEHVMFIIHYTCSKDNSPSYLVNKHFSVNVWK